MSLRLRLRRIVLEVTTRTVGILNLVVLGTILLSMARLPAQPHPLRLAVPGVVPIWVVQLEYALMLMFFADFLLHLWGSLKPLRYLFSFYGLIDVSAVLFFVPQISSDRAV